MSGNELTYVTGALISAERDDPVLWALHRAALERGTVPTVPAGVLAEAWRGGPQQHLSRLLKGCRIEALTEDQARAIGVLIPTSGVHNTGPPTAGPHWSALRYAPVVQPVPARSSGVLASQMGDRAIAYDLVTETAHRLNGIAGDLLSECTGHGDLVQLIDRWAELTGAPRQVVAADVDAALR